MKGKYPHADLLIDALQERVEELEEVLSAFVNWKTNDEGTLSLVDDEELWKRAEQVLENK
jgi:hypothetical protein